MTDRYFRSYIFPEDDDVVHVGLGLWNRRDNDPTPLLGAYLCDAAEVNARFDALEADLKRARRDALAKVARIARRRRS